MPVQTSLDVIQAPPRPVASRFELAARRIAETWIEEGCVRANAEDFRLAAEFLKRCGQIAELLPGLEVRLVSERGRVTITTREGAVIAALRCLAVLDAQRATLQAVAYAA